MELGGKMVLLTGATGGLGIAILLSVAYEPERDRNVRIVKAAHLFEPTIPQLILRQGKYLSSYMHEFIKKVAPQWDRQAIDAAVKSRAKDV